MFKVLLFYPNEPLLGIAPSNLAILSACLKRANFDVKLFDCTLYKPQNKETQDQTRENLGQVKKTNIEDYIHCKTADIYEDFVNVVNEYKPNLIAATLIDSTIKFTLSFIEKIKDKKIPVVTGGVGSTFLYKKILNSNLVDYVCIGEGEEAIVELAQNIRDNKETTKIQNIYTKGIDGGIKKNTLRRLVNLDDLPIPDFSIYEYDRFYRPFLGKVVRMLQVDIDRGCPFICTYCAAPTLREKYKLADCGNYYRVKNLNKAFNEMTTLIKQLDINCLWISSETLLALPFKKFKLFAERYKEEINLPFWCQSRLDTFTEEKTKLLAEMGCKAISVGLEHGSEKIRKELLHKNISNETVLEAIKTLSKYNITITVNNMIGFPDETRQNIFETVELNKQINEIMGGKHTINVFTFIPFSGTELRRISIEKRYVSEDVDIPISFFTESMLTMPSISKKELKGLEKTLALYIFLPKEYWPNIIVAEQDDEEGRKMFNKLIKIKNELNKR